MIYTALDLVKDKLDSYIKRRFNLSENVVVLSNILDLDGSVALNATNRILISLVNLEKETVINSARERIFANENKTAINSQPMHFNIYILISAYFSSGNYDESLKFISAVLNFFQTNTNFNHQNVPELNENIEKLCFEIVNMNLQEISHLWGVLGGKYLPSVLFKIRMVTFNSNEIKYELTKVSNNVSDISGK